MFHFGKREMTYWDCLAAEVAMKLQDQLPIARVYPPYALITESREIVENARRKRHTKEEIAKLISTTVIYRLQQEHHWKYFMDLAGFIEDRIASYSDDRLILVEVDEDEDGAINREAS